MKKFNLAIIGFGCRGCGMTYDVFSYLDNVNITAICDLYEDRAKNGADLIHKLKGNTPFYTTDYHEVLKRDDVDAVYIATSWEYHSEIAVDAMYSHKAVAMEVGGAYSLDECYGLIKAYEETKTPFMFMENCCYGKDEVLVTSMVRKGKLGKIVHCAGAYSHDLRGEVSGGNINRHYRLRNYINRNCENYPTHELGPIARLLNINRGNRMVSLSSMSSGAYGLEEYLKNQGDKADPSLKGVKFSQGDVVTTLIKCSGGETITIRLDTTLPKYYNREFTVRGTKGLYEQGANMFFFDGMDENSPSPELYRSNINNAENYKEFLPEEWKEVPASDTALGHGGMDMLEFKAFFKALENGDPMPIDVYDAASWMCITCLSEISIAHGGEVQSIPDFTDGKWLLRKPFDVLECAE